MTSLRIFVLFGEEKMYKSCICVAASLVVVTPIQSEDIKYASSLEELGQNLQINSDP